MGAKKRELPDMIARMLGPVDDTVVVWVGDRDAVLGVGSVEAAVNQGSMTEDVVGQIVVVEDVRSELDTSVGDG